MDSGSSPEDLLVMARDELALICPLVEIRFNASRAGKVSSETVEALIQFLWYFGVICCCFESNVFEILLITFRLHLYWYNVFVLG